VDLAGLEPALPALRPAVWSVLTYETRGEARPRERPRLLQQANLPRSHTFMAVSSLSGSRVRIRPRWGTSLARHRTAPVGPLRGRLEVLRDRIAEPAPDVATGIIQVSCQADRLFTETLRPELHALALRVAALAHPLFVESALRRLPSDLLGTSTLACVQTFLLACHRDHLNR
jgi:hypothetical protein